MPGQNSLRLLGGGLLLSVRCLLGDFQLCRFLILHPGKLLVEIRNLRKLLIFAGLHLAEKSLSNHAVPNYIVLGYFLFFLQHQNVGGNFEFQLFNQLLYELILDGGKLDEEFLVDLLLYLHDVPDSYQGFLVVVEQSVQLHKGRKLKKLSLRGGELSHSFLYTQLLENCLQGQSSLSRVFSLELCKENQLFLFAFLDRFG